MSQPPAYTPSTNFSVDADMNPADPIDAADLDVEFQAIEQTLDQLVPNIGLLQRDDGALANLSVHPDALSTATRLLIANGGTLSQRYRGVWATGQTYATGDLVTVGAFGYMALVAHVAAGSSLGADLLAGKWLALDGGAAVVTPQMFGAVGNRVADDTMAIQTAINAMGVNASGEDKNPSVLKFQPKGYYSITAPLTFPEGFVGNTVDLCGSRIYYDGPLDSTAAIFKVTKNIFIRNTIMNGSLFCEDRCGFGIYCVGEGNLYATSEIVLDTIDVWHPVIRGIQIGRQSVTGYDQDCALWSLRDVRVHLNDGQEGIEINADNSFNTQIFNFGGLGYGNSHPGTYIRLKKGNSLYVHSLFTGDNGTDVPAVEINNGNVGIWGWNTEGNYLLKMEGFVGGAGNVTVDNVNINDGEGDGTIKTAINAPNGELVLSNAKLHQSSILPQKVIVGDKLIANNVRLGSNSDGSVFGQFILDHPERCVIDGTRLVEFKSLNPNPNLDLWWGSAADDMPIGYEKSALGTATITRSTSNLLYTQYTARVQITVGAAVSGQLTDGIISRTYVGINSHAGAKSYVGIVRGKVVSITGTTTVKLRITFVNAFGSVNGSNTVSVTPDVDGNFTAILNGNPDTTDPPVEVLLNFGLGVNAATADIYVQTCHLIPMQGYLQGASYSYYGTVDAWTKYPSALDLVEEHAKAGVTARFNSATSTWIREWLGTAAPTTGTHARGSHVINRTPAALGALGWVCTVAGTPGTWVVAGVAS